MLKLLDEVKVVRSKGWDNGYLGGNAIIVDINKYDDEGIVYTIVGFCSQRYDVCLYEDSFWACGGWKDCHLEYVKSNTTVDIEEMSKNKKDLLYAKTLEWMHGNYAHNWIKLKAREESIKEDSKIISLSEYRRHRRK